MEKRRACLCLSAPADETRLTGNLTIREQAMKDGFVIVKIAKPGQGDLVHVYKVKPEYEGDKVTVKCDNGREYVFRLI